MSPRPRSRTENVSAGRAVVGIRGTGHEFLAARNHPARPDRTGSSGCGMVAMAGPQQRTLLRGVVASHAVPAIVAVPGPQGVNSP